MDGRDKHFGIAEKGRTHISRAVHLSIYGADIEGLRRRKANPFDLPYVRQQSRQLW